MLEAQGRHLLDIGVKLLVELAYLVVPHLLALGNLVKLVLHLGREVVVENRWEILHEEVVDHHAHIGGQQLALLGAGELALARGLDLVASEHHHLIVALGALALALLHIAAGLNGRDGGGVGRRAPYAQLLERAHERGLGVACRLLREALRGRDVAGHHALARGHGRQGVHVGRGGIGVGRLDIDLQEAVEVDDLARGREVLGAVAHCDVDRGALELGVGHLRGNGALPYQVVELLLLGSALDVAMGNGSGAYGLVGLLGALAGGVVLAYLEVLLAQRGLNLVAYGSQGQVGEVERVGTHVGDESRLIERLGHAHRLRHREAQLAGGLLLQGRGGERRGRRLLHWLHGHCSHREAGRAAGLEKGHSLVVRLETRVQLGRHTGLAALGLHRAGDAVVGLALEVAYLLLALGDEPHRHTLHAPGRQGRLYLLPQHRRELKAHDAVEHAARLLGIDQVDVDGAGVLDGLHDGRLGDLVKHDALGILGLEPQHLVEMPRDGLSLAVLIRGQPHRLGLLGSLLEVGHEGFLVAWNFIYRLKAIVDVDAEVLLVQVTYVPVARHHLVVISQKLLDGLGLGRRLYNH